MRLGFSGEGFGNLLVVSTFVGFIFYSFIFFRAYRRGVDVTKTRFVLKSALITVFIFVVIPLWFSDLDISWKLMATIASVAAGILNFFAVDRAQKIYKELFHK